VMTPPRTHKISPGVYEVLGTTDADDKPYRVVKGLSQYGRSNMSGGLLWSVEDSRGRFVSSHFTKAGAIESLVE